MRPAFDVEVPRALRTRPKDRRGYPVPFIVMVDTAKRPHFQINDAARVIAAGRKKLCGLCGGKLRGDVAFVGGPVCFHSAAGAFSDPAMHAECARYALRVCPYLAAPSYAKRIDDRTVDPAALGPGVMIGKDEQMPDDRPVLFALGTTSAMEMFFRPDGVPLFRQTAEWTGLEYWRGGLPIDGDELARALALDRRRAPVSY